jgi:glycerol-3-phosphate dehydrogenase
VSCNSEHAEKFFSIPQGVTLPESLRASGDMAQVVSAAEIILVVGFASRGCNCKVHAHLAGRAGREQHVMLCSGGNTCITVQCFEDARSG